VFNDVVSDVSYARFAVRVEVLGQERRRRWSDAKKRDIVMSVGIDGATVSEVAQRHDVTRQQVYTWRRELKRKAVSCPSSNVAFVPVEVAALQDGPVRGDTTGGYAGLIELRLNCGRSLRFDGGVDTALLVRLIRAVETA
jgi:transposase